MAEQEAIALLSNVLNDFIPHVTSLAINASDKVGFDLDTTGRKREVLMINENIQSAYNEKNVQVNIAIWNMHIDEEHHFNNIIVSGLTKMGNGGGFRVVVFKGDGYLKNNGDRGFENWCCSGNQTQNNNIINFGSI